MIKRYIIKPRELKKIIPHKKEWADIIIALNNDTMDNYSAIIAILEIFSKKKDYNYAQSFALIEATLPDVLWSRPHFDIRSPYLALFIEEYEKICNLIERSCSLPFEDEFPADITDTRYARYFLEEVIKHPQYSNLYNISNVILKHIDILYDKPCTYLALLYMKKSQLEKEVNSIESRRQLIENLCTLLKKNPKEKGYKLQLVNI